jgi:hypothetical protein
MPEQSEQDLPKIGLYIEVVMHGHGAHEIIGAWDVPLEKTEELQQIIETRPDMFTERRS